MITLKVVEKQLNRGAIQVTVEFSGQGEAFTETYQIGTLDELIGKVRSRISSLEATETVLASIPLGGVTLPALPVQTQDSIDKMAWMSDYYILQQADKLLKLGIVTATDTDKMVQIEALRTSLNTRFKIEYLTNL
jgi:hypothetical protein